jgi:hypothetical protein
MRSHDLKGIPISLDKDPVVDYRKILYPSDLFDGVLGAMDQNQETKSTVRLVWFLATATIANHDPAKGTFKCRAFCDPGLSKLVIIHVVYLVS